MVFFVFSYSFNIEIYSKKQKLNNFLERYKALLPWINSNNVELKFLTIEEFQKLHYDHSLNSTINMLILNNFCVNITCEQLKGILNSLKLTILSLEDYDSIPDGLLEICSEFPTLQCLQVEHSKFPPNLNLEKTYFKNIIFNHVYFKVGTDVGMPLCLKKFHLNLNLLGNGYDDEIELRMNQCEYIEEL
jgi:hypothetical protein